MEKKKKNKSTSWTILAILIVGLLLVVVGVMMLFRSEEVYISSDDEGITTIDAITCTVADYDGDAFFEPGEAKKYSHNIKVTFSDDKIDKLFYTYNGTYESRDRAEVASSKFHANYNTYMGEKGLSISSLSPSFSVVDNDMRVTLFADRDDINNDTTEFFFLSMDDFQRIGSYSPEDLEKIYENKGFDCISKN